MLMAVLRCVMVRSSRVRRERGERGVGLVFWWAAVVVGVGGVVSLVGGGGSGVERREDGEGWWREGGEGEGEHCDEVVVSG